MSILGKKSKHSKITGKDLGNFKCYSKIKLALQTRLTNRKVEMQNCKNSSNWLRLNLQTHKNGNRLRPKIYQQNKAYA